MVRLRISATPPGDSQDFDPPPVEPSASEPQSPPRQPFIIPEHWVDREGMPLTYYPVRYNGPPEAWYAELQKLKPSQCGWPDGKTLSSGNHHICRRPRAEGMTRCRRHGGRGRGRGLVSLQTEGGAGFSRYLPKDYWAIYRRIKEDPKLLEIRQDVELIAVRQAEMVKQLHSGESGSLWKELKDTWKEVQAAIRKQDQERLAAALQVMGKIIADANKREHLWRDLGNWTDRVVTLKRAEHQRLRELHEMLTVERFLEVLAGYHEVVLEVTPEKERRVKLARRLQTIIESGMGEKCGTMVRVGGECQGLWRGVAGGGAVAEAESGEADEGENAEGVEAAEVESAESSDAE